MNERRTVKKYSESFKLAIVSEVEKGNSINSVKERYGITGGETIQKWIKRYGRNELLNKKVIIMTTKEVDELARLRKELKELKLMYADLAIDHKCSEMIIKLADETMGLDLKKNYDQLRSQQSGRDKGEAAK